MYIRPLKSSNHFSQEQHMPQHLALPKTDNKDQKPIQNACTCML